MLHLRRITSGGRFIPEIDGLRFVAIASVVLYHLHGFVAGSGAVAATQDSFRPLAEHGYRGVNLFYVISGFILGLPFAAQALNGGAAVSLRSYFLRRLTRLEPPYILNLLICFAMVVAVQKETPGAMLPHLAASLGYLHNLIFGAQSPINPVAWTLEIEVQFYCLVPLLAVVFHIPGKSARRATLVLLILAAGIAQTVFWNGPERLKLSILFEIQFFLAGFLLADIYLLDWRQSPTRRWMWDLIALSLWPPLFLLDDRIIWILFPFAALALYMAAFRGVVSNRVFTNPVITVTGGMCYTIYLFHYILIPHFLRMTKHVHSDSSFNGYFAVQLLLFLPLLMTVSFLYFVLVERPCMDRNWPRRLVRRMAPRGGTASTGGIAGPGILDSAQDAAADQDHGSDADPARRHTRVVRPERQPDDQDHKSYHIEPKRHTGTSGK
jgi:peptidoglycan/LPS O-acetylase OafA/YrhL